MDDNNIVFACKHCGNTDMRHMQINAVTHQNPDYKPYPYNMDVAPYVNVGLHIDCAKCNKDTVILIEDFHKNNTPLTPNVPKEVLVHVKFEKPKFSATKFILTDDMTLDQVVVDINNQMISLITREFVTVGYKEITEEQYKCLKNKKVEEVKVKQQQAELTPPVHGGKK